MKSSAELEQIRQSLRYNITLRDAVAQKARIIIGMGDDAVAAGARAIVQAVGNELEKNQVTDVALMQKYYADQNAWAPVMWIEKLDGNNAICARMTAERVPEELRKHLPEFFKS